jgi:hypothetical protein
METNLLNVYQIVFGPPQLSPSATMEATVKEYMLELLEAPMVKGEVFSTSEAATR